jgi:hypothetical protein
LYCTFHSKCLDCLMIFNIELPFYSNKTRIRTGSESDGSGSRRPKNHGSGSDILSLLIFYTTFRQIEVFAKTFREKLTKFRENCDTFRKSFRFRERTKKCFRPNPTPYHFLTLTKTSLGILDFIFGFSGVKADFDDFNSASIWREKTLKMCES